MFIFISLGFNCQVWYICSHCVNGFFEFDPDAGKNSFFLNRQCFYPNCYKTTKLCMLRERIELSWWICCSHPLPLTQTICACQLPVFGMLPKPSSWSLRDYQWHVDSRNRRQAESSQALTIALELHCYSKLDKNCSPTLLWINAVAIPRGEVLVGFVT